jgi:hypothetical protein
MSQWLIAGKTKFGVYEAMDIMKAEPAECDDEGRDRWIEFLKKEGRWNDEVCGARPIASVNVDGGGMMMIGEPDVAWEANGCKFETPMRQVRDLLELFKRRILKPVEAFPSCGGFGGFHRKYFFALKTMQDSIPLLEKLADESDKKVEEIEKKLQAALNACPNAVSVRPCSCASGRQYGDCCGKAVESAEHKEMRRGINAGEIQKN